MKTVFISLVLLISFNLYAFPEMIRHGYTNCTACHVSPSGGGSLNQYGRSLSKEVLSTWGTDKEENFLHGAIDTESVNDWLVTGGDIRAVQVHQENDNIKRGKFIKMQAGIELGINRPKWAIVGSFGHFDNPSNDQEWKPDFTRYYALYRVIDGLTLRGGRFLPSFGINNSEHILSTRGPLGFGYGVEKDTVEASWLGENWNFVGSYYKTQKQLTDTNESGFTALVSKIFGNNKVGVQYLNEKNNNYKRQIYGATGLLGWSEHFYTTVEYDKSLIEMGSTSTKMTGHYFLHCSGYEFYKGFHGLILNDYMQTDENDGTTKNYKFGPGFQWFPRPHFDIQFYWTRQQSLQNAKSDGDYAWMVFHYYL
ncbi:MAG: hypothetical protein H7235_00630 [Bdellovibrionaceae bacterium]|nr:hypothetical protein [Pseudobdellovibrionaceae bacterium]